MLSCESCLTRLEESVEERTALPVEVHTHLRQCLSETCQSALLEYELLSAVIPVWKESLPGIDMVQKVVHQTLETTAMPSAERSRSQAAFAAVQQRDSRRGAMTSIVAVVGALSLSVFGIVQTFPVTPLTANSLAIQPPAGGTLDHPVLAVSTDQQAEVPDAGVEAELREFGKVYGSWVQVASHKLTDTVTVVFLDEPKPEKPSNGWFFEMTEQLEQPLESTLKFLIEEASTEVDEQTFVPVQTQKEYFGFFWSKSESLNPLFTLMFV